MATDDQPGWERGAHGAMHEIVNEYKQHPTMPGAIVVPGSRAFTDEYSGRNRAIVDVHAPADQICDPGHQDGYTLTVAKQLQSREGFEVISTTPSDTPESQVATMFPDEESKPAPVKLSAAVKKLNEPSKTVAVTFHMQGFKHTVNYHAVELQGPYLYLVALVGSNPPPPDLDITAGEDEASLFKLTIKGHDEMFLCVNYGQRVTIDRFDITILGVREKRDLNGGGNNG